MSIQVVSYEINDVDGKIEWMFLGTVDVPKPEPAPKLKHQQIIFSPSLDRQNSTNIFKEWIRIYQENILIGIASFK